MEQQPYIAVFWGHGGSDSGAVYKDRKEKAFNREVAQKLIALLEKKGYRVLTDRTKDADTTIAKRAQLANQAKVDAAVEVHHNVGGGQGSEAYYYEESAEGRKLAQALTEQLSSLGFRNRGAKKDSTSRYGQFGIIRQTNAPCVLLECCFLDSDADMNLASSQQKAEAIAQAILIQYPLRDAPAEGEPVEVIYTVQRGDTLTSIARQYGITYPEIAAYNGLQNPNKLAVGQKLKIPTAKQTIIQLGDVVQFLGGDHYENANAAKPSGGKRSAGKAKVSNISQGAKHAYHLIGQPGGSNVYGWVDGTTIQM